MEEYLQTIQQKCEFLLTTDQMTEIRYALALYSRECLENKEMADEAESICWELLDKDFEVKF